MKINKYIKILFLIQLISCQDSDIEKQIEQEEIGFFDEELLFTTNDPILNIYCEFTECGEWGGHEEYIIISKTQNNSFKLSYEKYNVDCDSMLSVFDGFGNVIQPKKELIESREIGIQTKEKQAILNFSYEMVKSKFKERFPGHSGLILSIVNSDSTFFISTYGGNANHYKELIDKLNLNRKNGHENIN